MVDPENVAYDPKTSRDWLNEGYDGVLHDNEQQGDQPVGACAISLSSFLS